jgi:hypothetical protein
MRTAAYDRTAAAFGTGDHVMQILAGSLNVEVPGLLHAGYISASPRTFVAHGGIYRLAQATPKVIDVPAALALKESGKTGEQIARPATAQWVAPAGPFRPASGVGQAAGLSIAFVFFSAALGATTVANRARRFRPPS